MSTASAYWHVSASRDAQLWRRLAQTEKILENPQALSPCRVVYPSMFHEKSQFRIEQAQSPGLCSDLSPRKRRTFSGSKTVNNPPCPNIIMDSSESALAIV